MTTTPYIPPPLRSALPAVTSFGKHVLPRLVLAELVGTQVAGAATYTTAWRRLLDKPRLHLLLDVALDNGAQQTHVWVELPPYALKCLRGQGGRRFRFRGVVVAYLRANGSTDYTFRSVRVEEQDA